MTLKTLLITSLTILSIHRQQVNSLYQNNITTGIRPLVIAVNEHNCRDKSDIGSAGFHTKSVSVLFDTVLEKEYFNFENYIKPLWEGDTIYSESVLLVKDEANAPQAKLLYSPDKIISVTDATLQIEYKEGIDYTINENTIKLTPDTKAVYMTKNELYVSDPANAVPVINGSTYIRIQPGTSEFYQEKQLFVTYTHKEQGLDNYVAPRYNESLLPKTTTSLKSGKSIKVLVFGDSLGASANSSSFNIRMPFMPDWGTLVVRKLMQKYKSEIFYENSSVGGTTSIWGKENAKKLVAEKNPDLVIIAFGMGDAFITNNFTPDLYRFNIQSIMDEVKLINPNCEFILVSPILANPEAFGFSGRQAEYVAPLRELQSAGVAFADVSSADQVILRRKKFFDIAGNGVNHPNDFIYRLYAQVVLKLLIADNSISATENVYELKGRNNLLHNYPNPFNATTRIKYTIPQKGNVTLKVYNTEGQEVATLVNQEQEPGEYVVDFNASQLTQGVYMYRIRIGDYTLTKKMTFQK